MSYKELVKQSFPKIIGIGKNYINHIKEMGGSEAPKTPVIFLKPWSSLSFNPKTLSLPIAGSHRIDHELQLGVYIKKGGSNISIQDAMSHVGGYFIGIDLTDRDLQNAAKAKGLPWTLSKGQDNFCPVSELINIQINPYQVELELLVNDKLRQKDMTSSMHFKIDHLISYTSSLMTLNEGDLILTGTPQGVGPVQIGNKVQGFARVNGKVLVELSFQVTK